MKKNKAELRFDHEKVSFIEEDGVTREVVSIPSDYFVSKCHHLEGRSMHSHNCVEMFYVLKGTCTHVLRDRSAGEEKKVLRAGNYMILDHTVSHGFENLSPDFHLANVLFRPGLVDSTLHGEISVKDLLSHPAVGIGEENAHELLFNRPLTDHNGKILQMVEKAWQVFQSHDYGTRALLRCYVIEILVTSMKNLLSENRFAGRDRIVSYLTAQIDKHYAEDISLSGLCAEQGWNTSFVSRKFKESTGINFETYLQQTRCKNACILLIETNLPIERIGERVGYFDPGSFRRIFKRMLGISASAFRRYNR